MSAASRRALPRGHRPRAASVVALLLLALAVLSVVAAVAAVIGLIALRWVLVQACLGRVRSLALDPDAGRGGRTSMPADALTDVIEDDLTGYPGVDRARVLLIGAPEAPELVLRVSAHPAADLVDVRRRIVTDALPAVRTALDAETVPVQLHLLVAGRRPSTPARTVR